MALSEESKQELKNSVETLRKVGDEDGVDWMRTKGPQYLLNDVHCGKVLSLYPNKAPIVNNIRENRKEAEQYLGGLLGMG